MTDNTHSELNPDLLAVNDAEDVDENEEHVPDPLVDLDWDNDRDGSMADFAEED